jgi:competence protein ComEA
MRDNQTYPCWDKRKMMMSAALAAALIVLTVIYMTAGPGGQKKAKLQAIVSETCPEETAEYADAGAGEEAEETAKSAAQPVDPGGTSAIAVIYVHVCGAVHSPGVYALEQGDRIFTAVQKAGGFAEGAEESFLNLAEPLADGQKVYVPDKAEAASLAAPAQNGTEKNGEAPAQGNGLSVMKSGESQAEQRVNINTASLQELMTLPGIGKSRAEDILTYRSSHVFQKPEDLMKVPGIKEGSFRKLKDLIRVQ